MKDPAWMDGDDFARGIDEVPEDYFEEDNSHDEDEIDDSGEPDRMWDESDI
jgi:hypothetical protein